MSHGKETPRQKMIGMMYLVLMAMLALNVSNEVLNAFAVLDTGLSSTRETVEQANGQIMSNFEAQYSINRVRVEEWYDKAKEVHEKAEHIVEFIQEQSLHLVGKLFS